ncbi:uncharacterized protein LOC130757813 [Actinidia eriantha]|uniref:uncharacterized protein LOC130757813 n=1 Tax=Actinidia eriantha TaxID=165200 RepID=UPI00258F3CC1|nr:uncharacterized protein LOC130757813 [Actinidia eriantha]
MAISTHRLLLLLSIVLGLLAIAATARPGRYFHPCKTLILFTSSSSAYPLDQNPNFPLENPNLHLPNPTVTIFFTEFREFRPKPAFIPTHPTIFVDRAAVDEENRPLPFGLYSSVGASFRDRTKDILSVVGSLLFGVGCGAITAATLYLMWSLFSGNRFDIRHSEDEYDEEDSDDGEYDDVSPKKMGYVAIPVAAAPVAAVPAKEVA